MNESFEEIFEYLKENLISSVAFFLIGLLLFLYFLYILWQIVPGYKIRNELNFYKASTEERLDAANTAQLNTIEGYKSQLDQIPIQLSETGTFLVTNNAADRLVNRLFSYADQTGVDISSLETKNAPQGEFGDLYSIRQYQLEAIGEFPNLMRFVSRIEEVRYPGYLLDNIIFNRVEEQETLTMVISVYTSPYGNATLIEAEADPLIKVEPDIMVEIVADPTMTPSPTATPEPVPPTPVTHQVLPGDTLFSIGQLYGVTVAELQVANNLAGNLIYADQQLIIPPPP